MIIFERLTEAFTRPAKYRWVDKTQAQFTLNGDYYSIDIFKKINRSTHYTKIIVSFSKNGSHDLVKGSASDALTVMSTVLAATQEVVNKSKPDEIEFTAYDDDDKSDAQKRFNVYEKLAQKMANQYGYDVTTNGRDIIMKSHVPQSMLKHFPNDGITESDNIEYVSMNQCNHFTWGKLFDAEKRPVTLKLTNGSVTITKTENGIFSIDGFGPRGEIKSLDSIAVWRDLLGDIEKNGDRMFEKGDVIGKRMIVCDNDTLYYLKDKNDFDKVW